MNWNRQERDEKRLRDTKHKPQVPTPFLSCFIYVSVISFLLFFLPQNKPPSPASLFPSVRLHAAPHRGLMSTPINASGGARLAGEHALFCPAACGSPCLWPLVCRLASQAQVSN